MTIRMKSIPSVRRHGVPLRGISLPYPVPCGWHKPPCIHATRRRSSAIMKCIQAHQCKRVSATKCAADSNRISVNPLTKERQQREKYPWSFDISHI